MRFRCYAVKIVCVALPLLLASCEGLDAVDSFSGLIEGDTSIQVSDDTLQFSTSSFDFGSISTGGSAIDRRVTVSNVSSFPIIINSLVETGDDDIGLVSTTCANAGTLDSNSSCELVVAYSPTSLGRHSKIFTFDYFKEGQPSQMFSSESTLVGSGVSPVIPSPVNSVISVSSASLVSGGTVTVTLTARDSGNNYIGSGGADVYFMKDSGTASGSWIPDQSLNTATDNGDGTYSAQLTGVLSGSMTITATISGAVFSGTKPAVIITPGTPVTLNFIDDWASGSPAIEQAAGFALNPQPLLELKDAAGNLVDTSATVTLSEDASSTGASGVIGTDSETSSNGTFDFSGNGFGFSSAGNKVILATVSGLPITSTSATGTLVAPTLSIASNKDLKIAHMSSDLGVTPANKSVLDSLTLPAITVDTASAISSITTGGGVVATGGIVEATTGSTPINLVDTSFNATITASRNNSISSSCSSLGVFSGLLCSFTTFSLTFNDLKDSATTGSDEFKISDGFVDSNGIAVNKYVITQITNTYTADTDDPRMLGVFNNKLWFYSKNQTSNRFRLYSVDTAGTVTQEKYIRGTGADDVGTGVDPTGKFKVWNNKAYFPSRYTGQNKTKLVSMDTSGNLTIASNTRTGNFDDYPESLFKLSYEDALYFVARNGSGKKKLYRLNNDASITQISNLQTAANADDPAYLTEFNDALYFRSRLPSGGKLKLFKLKNGVITQVSNFKGNGADDTVRSLRVKDSFLYFSALNSSNNKYKLFKMDTNDNISQVIKNRADNSDEGVDFLTVFNDYVYFYGKNAANLGKLQRYDPVGNTVTEVSNLIGGGNDDRIARMVVWGNELVIVATVAAALDVRKLYIMNTSEEIFRISDVVPYGSDDPSSFVNFDDALYFVGNADTSANKKIFKLERK